MRRKKLKREVARLTDALVQAQEAREFAEGDLEVERGVRKKAQREAIDARLETEAMRRELGDAISTIAESYGRLQQAQRPIQDWMERKTTPTKEEPHDSDPR